MVIGYRQVIRFRVSSLAIYSMIPHYKISFAVNIALAGTIRASNSVVFPNLIKAVETSKKWRKLSMFISSSAPPIEW